MPAVSVGVGLVAASLPVEAGSNVVLYERDFTSAMLPWQALEPRGVELRLVPLEGLADAVDERTAVVCVSLVQSAEGRVVDLDALRATGVRICLDATQAVAAFPIDLTGVDYLVAHGYKWMLCPRGLGFLYVSPERRDELGLWTAGWKARVDPYEDYYGMPDMPDEARRLDVSVPWLSAAGARKSLELLVSLGNDRIAEHNLGLARSLTSKLGLAGAGIADRALPRRERRRARPGTSSKPGIACAVRAGSVRLSFHLYNDEQDVDLAVAALATGNRAVCCRLPRVIRLLVRTAVAVAANAVGLLVAAAVLDGVHLDGGAFIVAVVIFTVAFALLQPFLSSSR